MARKLLKAWSPPTTAPARKPSATGPYRIASFEVDKQIVLDANCFGYHDGNHEGQYMTDTIKIDIIGEHTTALLLFNQGSWMKSA